MVTRKAIDVGRKQDSHIPVVRSLRLAFAQRHVHFAIDVVGQYARGKRSRGAETTLYYGLNSAYALSQALFAALALLAISQRLMVLGRWPGLSLGFLAALSWLAICVLFLKYRQPRMTVGLFTALLAAAALTTQAPQTSTKSEGITKEQS